jgi:hypothetical protein
VTERLLVTKGPSGRRRNRAGMARARQEQERVRKTLLRCPRCGRNTRKPMPCEELEAFSEEGRKEHAVLVAEGREHIHVECTAPGCGHVGFVSFGAP